MLGAPTTQNSLGQSETWTLSSTTSVGIYLLELTSGASYVGSAAHVLAGTADLPIADQAAVAALVGLSVPAVSG